MLMLHVVLLRANGGYLLLSRAPSSFVCRGPGLCEHHTRPHPGVLPYHANQFNCTGINAHSPSSSIFAGTSLLYSSSRSPSNSTPLPVLPPVRPPCLLETATPL